MADLFLMRKLHFTYAFLLKMLQTQNKEHCSTNEI